MKTHSQGSGRTDGPPVGYAASVDDSRYGGLSSNKGGGGRGGGKGTKDGGNGGGDYSPTRVRASSSSQLGSPDVPPHLMPLENGGGARGRQQQGPSGSQTFTYGQNYNTSNASSSSSYVMPGDCNDTFLGGNSNGATLGFVDVRLTRPPDGMKPPERPSDSKSKRSHDLYPYAYILYCLLYYCTYVTFLLLQYRARSASPWRRKRRRTTR